MKFLRLLSLFAFGAGSALWAGPCVTGSLASYILLGATGCSIGPFTDTNFAFTVIGSTVPIAASDITITPTTSPDHNNLEFTSSKFNAGPADSIKILISYFWDAGDLRSLDEVLGDPIFGPGLSQLTVNGCENANFVGANCPTTAFTLTLTATSLTPPTISASEPFAPGTVTTLGMRDTVEIDGNNCVGHPVCADITDFEDTAQTPEPSAIVLGLLPAGACVLFGWIKRRRVSSSLGPAPSSAVV